MAATDLLYATGAAGQGLSGQLSAWANLVAATGAPDGSFATNNNRVSPGYQRLTLTGYDPVGEVLDATGDVEPYSLDFLHVQVTFTLDSATNYDSIDVLLLNGDGSAIARQPLYLDDATTGVTIVGWVNFTGHNGYDDQQRLTWDEIDGCSIAVDVTRSGAAGTDTLKIDAVGLFVAYTVDPPTTPVVPAPPIEVQPPGGGVTLRVYDRHGDRLGVLPWSDLSTTIVRNDLGALKASSPKGLILPGLLDGERYLRVAVNGVESPDWFLLDDDGDDDADDGGLMRPVSIGGSSTAGILDWGLVYSWEYEPLNDATIYAEIFEAETAAREAKKNWDRARERQHMLASLPNPTDPEDQTALDQFRRDADTQVQLTHDASVAADLQLAQAREAQDVGAGILQGLDPTNGFAGKTPGFILGSLIDEAKARGCFPHLDYSFTDEVDSAGLAWPTIYSRTYDVGTSLLKVLTTMGEDGWVDWEMSGFTLDLYVPDTALAVDRPDVVLRLGKGVTQAPRKRSRKAARSVLLANGAEGATVELDDSAAIATWGRRESYEGRGGITDVGTLSAAAQVSLSRQTVASEAITLELDPYAMPEETPQLPRPGGYIRYDQRRLSPTKLEPLRLQSLAIDYGDDAKVSVELNDLWVDGDIKRARQLDGILNGSSGNERVPIPPDAPDTLAPGQVQGVGLTSTAYVAPDGTLGAQVTASWSEVTQNADGSRIRDLAGYEIQYQQPDVVTGVQTIRTAVTTLAQWSPVVPGEQIDVRIRAVDRYGNPGAWSPWTSIIAGDDVTPPPVPSTPEVDNYLGLLRVRWDGTFTGGAPRPRDLARVEVHVSSLDDFAPDPRPIEDGGTLAGSMVAPGPVFVDVPYGEQRYAKLVGVDTTGNRSDPSEQASGASGQVVAADVFDGAIGSAKLADLAVTSAKINLLAVNSAQVGTIEVGKLIAGTMTAEVIMGGRIATADTGQRVELNALGIWRYDALGNVTVRIDNNGALLTGTYKTADTGRRVEIGAGATTGRIDFWSPDGDNGFVRSYTESYGILPEAIQIGMVPYGLTLATADYLWNRLNINTSATGDYTTLRSGTLELMYSTASDAGYINGRFAVYSTNQGRLTGLPGNITRERFTIGGGPSSQGEAYFRPGEYGRVQIVGTTDAKNSPQLQIITGTAGKVGLAWRVQVRPSDGIPLMQLVYNGTDSFAYAQANAWDTMSDVALKENVRPVEADEAEELTSQLLSAPLHRYRYRDALTEREHIGLLAHQAPPQIVSGEPGHQSIDGYQFTASVLLLAKQLDARLRAIEERQPA